MKTTSYVILMLVRNALSYTYSWIASRHEVKIFLNNSKHISIRECTWPQPFYARQGRLVELFSIAFWQHSCLTPF